MPPSAMENLADALRHSGSLLVGLADALANTARQARVQPRRARGFQIVKDWDGDGVRSDRRWRGGRTTRRVKRERISQE
jgi:hypothetical protein